MKIRRILPAALLLTMLAASPVAYSNDIPPVDESHCEHNHMDKLWSKLPEAKRTLLQESMTKAHASNQSLYEERRKLHDQLDNLLLADTFDKKTYLDKSAKSGVIAAKIKAGEEDAFASIAAKLTPEERKILVRLREIGHHHKEWCHGEWYLDYNNTLSGKGGEHPSNTTK